MVSDENFSFEVEIAEDDTTVNFDEEELIRAAKEVAMTMDDIDDNHI